MLTRPSNAINVYGSTAVQGDPAQANFFNGGFGTTEIQRDPLLTGYAFIAWLKLPTWVTREYPSFKETYEKNFRAFSGMQDIDMNTVSVTEGFSASENQFAGSAQNFQGFSLTAREYSGSPIRNSITHWVTGIRDPRTNIARYPRQYNMEYSARNHTGELIYIVTRPDADNTASNGKNIEFACLWTMVMPTRAPFSHLNFTAGTNDNPELELPFTGVPIINKAVDDLAVQVLKRVSANIQTMSEVQRSGR